MKISDKELRAMAAGNVVWSKPRPHVAEELLQRRSEVRRLRKALRRIAAGSAGWIDIADAALKPQRGGK